MAIQNYALGTNLNKNFVGSAKTYVPSKKENFFSIGNQSFKSV